MPVTEARVEDSRGQESLTHVHQEVEQAGVECFGEGVSGEGGLLSVEGDSDGLRLPTPLAVHDAAGQLIL